MDIVSAVIGPMARDVEGVLMLTRALLTDHMAQLDRATIPVPFREEVSESAASFTLSPLTIVYCHNNNEMIAYWVRCPHNSPGFTLISIQVL